VWSRWTSCTFHERFCNTQSTCWTQRAHKPVRRSQCTVDGRRQTMCLLSFERLGL
jgi:hypothetical protein